MAQTTFDGNLTPSEALLDQNFTQLYNLRELVSSPSYTAATPKFTIDGSFNWMSVGGGAVGYGVGSGGSVTQLTSKSTGVTINKPSGIITTNGAALAGGATVAFAVTNSVVASTDLVSAQLQSANNGHTLLEYQVWSGTVSNGSFYVAIKNVSGVSYSDTLVISFFVTKVSAS